MTPATQQDNPLYDRLRAVIAASRGLRNPLIEVLRQAQEIFGYLPVEVQEFISREMDIPANKIYGVVTFYNFFTMIPRGKYTLNLCMGTACYVRGGAKIFEELQKELEVEPGYTTNDRLFTLEATRCIGCCGLAPAMMIDGEVYGRLTTDLIHGIIDKYRQKG